MKCFVALFSLASVATLASCVMRMDTYRYLPVPKGNLMESEHFRQLYEVLSYKSVMSSLDSMSEQKKLATGDADDILGKLISLANHQETSCPPELVEFYLDVFGLVQELRPKRKEFVKAYSRFLKEQGLPRFAKCTELSGAFDAVELDASVEKAFFEKVIQLVSDEIMSEEDQYALASQMKESASRFGIEDECLILRSQLGPVFDLYNLAQMSVLSVGKAELNPSFRFRKLNEYNRICLQ